MKNSKVGEYESKNRHILKKYNYVADQDYQHDCD